MKIIVSVLFAASLMACGGKAKKSTTPDKADQTENTTVPGDGTGGTTYGGTTGTPAAGSAAEPGAGE
ncbi:MAG: hypothetical protein HOV81_02540 [Kofleriaceae bacterium]|nr:hypothetical protein [Kofleriaceae bacterium]